MQFKLVITISLMLLSTFLFSQNLELVENFGKNSGGLKMYIHKPQNLDNTKKYPLVVVLHGCTQNAKKVANATDWNKLADYFKFIVIYPEQRQINNVSKCFNFFIGFKAKKDKGEIASIHQMIKHTLETENIDSTQIFITGMSAGGAMSNAMLNNYPNLFNAGALIAAPSILLDSLSKSTKVPRIAILQGTDDNIVVKSNGDRIVEQWCKNNNLDTSNYSLKENFESNNLLSAKEFYADNKLVITYIIEKNVGHKILNDPGNDIKHGGVKGIHNKDIDFFSTYWIAKFWGIAE